MELLKRVEKEIPQKDSLRFDSRADKLNWDNVRQQLILNLASKNFVSCVQQALNWDFKYKVKASAVF
jgi:hypothetical protein